MFSIKKRTSLYLLVTYSLPLFICFLGLLGVLFAYTHSTKKSVLNQYQKIKSSHSFSAKLLEFSEENYHTQLELFEYAYAPNVERLQGFLVHKTAFLDKLTQLGLQSQEVADSVDPKAIQLLEELRKELPEIEHRWERVVNALRDRRGAAEVQQAVQECESYFDSIHFNSRVAEVVLLQNSHIAKFETDIWALLTDETQSIAIFILLCFGSLVTLVHRKTLKAQQGEMQLIQASKLAALGELSAGFAHELNTPLMIVQGYNGRLKALLKNEATVVNPAAWDYVDEISEGAERMKKIIQHFRDFSRPASADMRVLAINPIIEKSFALLSSQLYQNDVQVIKELSPELPLVLGNSNRLEQVLLNIIKNASDAFEDSPKTGARWVKVRTRADGKFTTIEIEDNGPGIAAENLHKVFTPFFTTKPVGQGTGLGLSVSHGIIREHGGRLEVLSKPGLGACFCITLPAVGPEL